MDQLLRKGVKFKSTNFIENNCRLCRNVYCCKKCREKHEINVHKIRPDCDICVYGKLYTINNKKSDFLTHLQKHHWPLHCVFCKLVFGNMDEIRVNRICPIGNKQAANSTFTKKTANDESPPVAKDLQNHILQYATSTPMQKSDETDFSFKDMHIVITPVDYLEEHSYVKNKTGSGENPSSAKNRRVTFSETGLESRKKIQPIESGQQCTKSELLDLLDDFQSAKENISKKEPEKHGKEGTISPYPEHMENRNNEVVTDPITKEDLEVQSLCVDIQNNENNDNLNAKEPDFTENTLWITALDEEKCTEADKPFVITRSIQKPTATGYPTPVLTRQDYKINFQICKKIFSTPIATKKESLETHPEPVIHEEKTEGKIYLRKEEIHLANNTTELVTENDHSLNGNLWNSVTKIVKNVIQGFGNRSNSSLKRSYSENETFLDDSPPERIKRFKFTDIKCRRPIRALSAIEYKVPAITYPRILARPKILVDKATQTDF